MAERIVVSRRRLLGLALAAGPLMAACRVDPYEAIGAPRLGAPGPSAGARPVLLWHADAVPGERLLAREVVPRLADERPGLALAPLAHGDPDDLLRRVGQAAAGGVGPDVLQLPGEWLPGAQAGGLLRPLPDGEAASLLAAEAWAPKVTEPSRWAGRAFGVPAAGWFRQPFFNDNLLRGAGLVEASRATPPSSWAEYADVSKRAAAPDDRWGALLPSHDGDEELFLHVYQWVHTAGGSLPRPRDGQVELDTPEVRAALDLLVDLVRNRGALPIDRPPFRLAETGRAALWWASSQWLGTLAAIGATPRLGATLVPRRAASGGRGAILRTRQWCLGGHGPDPDGAAELLRRLARDDLSHLYCAGLWLPPARAANRERPPYRPGPATPTPFAGLWPAVLDQLAQPDNLPLVTFPGYRAVAARVAGELRLVLTGKKPVATALSEGQAGVAELLRQGRIS